MNIKIIEVHIKEVKGGEYIFNTLNIKNIHIKTINWTPCMHTVYMYLKYIYGIVISKSFKKQSILTPNYLEGAPIYSLPSVADFASIIPKVVITVII